MKRYTSANNRSVELSDRSTARALIRPAFDRFEGLLVASGSGLMVRRRYTNTFPPQGAMLFVSGDLILLAVAELFVPVLDDADGGWLVGRALNCLPEDKAPAVR